MVTFSLSPSLPPSLHVGSRAGPATNVFEALVQTLGPGLDAWGFRILRITRKIPEGYSPVILANINVQ